MELMIRDGDYLPDGGGGLCHAEGDDALLQSVLWRLTIPQGSFPFLPALGSRLGQLPREKPSQWQGLAEQYVTEALSSIEGLSVTEVELHPADTGTELTVRLAWKGTELTAAVRLEG